MSEGVWTGSETDVTVPDGFIQPQICTAEQYSQCEVDTQCTLLISPGCSCYVSSSIHPYQACEGKDCNFSGCTGNECGGYVGVCQPGFNGTGNTCMLEETNDIGNTTAPVPTPAPSSAALASVSIMICIISISSAINYIAWLKCAENSQVRNQYTWQYLQQSKTYLMKIDGTGMYSLAGIKINTSYLT